jgi:hypothetical protein
VAGLTPSIWHARPMEIHSGDKTLLDGSAKEAPKIYRNL